MMGLRAQKQNGFSLIELMLALVTGLLLMIGAIQVLLASKATFRTNEDVARIQENGRFAINILARGVRMAGYCEPGNGDLPNLFFTDACDTHDPCTANGATTDSDRIAVQYDPTDDVDCFGNAVGANDVLAHLYRIVTVNGVNSLTCRSWNSTTDAWVSVERPLIDGIDGMQVLYGLRSAAGAGVTRYVSGDNVADWALVKAVRIAILVSKGTANGQAEEQIRKYVLLDSPILAFDDQHSRRVYSTTVMLNNAT